MNLGKSEEAAPYLFRVYLAVFPRILSPCKYCIFTFIISQCNIPFSTPSPFYPSFINLGKTWVNNALVIPKRSENPKTRLPQVFRNLGKHRYLATSLGKTRASSAIQIRHIIKKSFSHISCHFITVPFSSRQNQNTFSLSYKISELQKISGTL